MSLTWHCMHCHTFTVLPIAVSVSIMAVFLFSVVLSLAIALFVIHRRKRCKSLTTVSKLKYNINFVPFCIELCV